MVVDEQGLIYVMIVNSSYPLRCAHLGLEELQRSVRKFGVVFINEFLCNDLIFIHSLLQFVAKAGDRAATGRDGSLNGSCQGMLHKLCQKYDNLAEVDKLASVARKVDTVKLVMQESVERALQNGTKLESIQQASGNESGDLIRVERSK